MDELDFPKQKYKIKLMPRFVGDLEYRQQVNWNSVKPEVRERANLMFSRMRNELYELANGNDVNLTHISGADYKYTFTDGFATLTLKALCDNTGTLAYFVEEVEWKFKKLDWWNIIEKTNCKCIYNTPAFSVQCISQIKK